MASKTLIELINDVGKHLRRSDGTTFTTLLDDADVIFMHTIINTAKDLVEGEELWNTQSELVEFSSVIGTPTYDLSDSGVITAGIVTNERSKALQRPDGQAAFWDITTNTQGFALRQRDRQWVESQQAIFPNTSESRPIVFAIYQTGDGLTVSFPYPISQVRDYRLNIFTPQDELTTDTDVLLAPHRPVVLAAVAIAAEERGEELGLDAATWWELYNSALSQALVNNLEHDPVLVAD